jgi:hypothetical protein
MMASAPLGIATILQSFLFAAVHYNSVDINVTFKIPAKPVARADYFSDLIIWP